MAQNLFFLFLKYQKNLLASPGLLTELQETHII
jgi:hypothetical protein